MGIGAAAVLCGLLLVITAGLLINVQHAVIGQVILGERVLALLGFALAIAGVLAGGRVRLTPLAALAFLVPIWGVVALIIQEVWSSTNTWQARTVAYLIPFATLGLVALAPYAPAKSHGSVDPGASPPCSSAWGWRSGLPRHRLCGWARRAHGTRGCGGRRTPRRAC